MTISVFLVIISLVIFWYGVIPIIGGIVDRLKWRQFRQHFDELRLRPILDYSIYRKLEKEEKEFRFSGGFESITDRKTLWIQGENLTIPVSLEDARIYLLPIQKGDVITDSFDRGGEVPERINWNRVTTLTEGSRVYAGGSLVFRDDRWIFVSTKDNPLIVIFYDGPDRSLTTRTISAGRRRNAYWNNVTPYSLAMGALCLILISLSYLNRPVFRLTVITSLIALFIPLFPMIPPGILFTIICRRISWQARKFMVYSDLARLPLRYLTPDQSGGWRNGVLPGGEVYEMICCNTAPKAVTEGKIPPLITEAQKSRTKKWYIFGAVRDKDAGDGEELPAEPADPFATFGFLPEKPDVLSRRYAIASHTLNIFSWILLLAGIGINVFFIRLILILILS
ncbi:MAG: hypothetical protein FWF29_04275 [Treponema sp.]|nr:hypothetical protein [Treponema sp.]